MSNADCWPDDSAANPVNILHVNHVRCQTQAAGFMIAQEIFKYMYEGCQTLIVLFLRLTNDVKRRLLALR